MDDIIVYALKKAKKEESAANLGWKEIPYTQVLVLNKNDDFIFFFFFFFFFFLSLDGRQMAYGNTKRPILRSVKIEILWKH